MIDIFKDEESLNSLNVYQLRELARRVGIDSPTSKKKNELINNIIAMAEGKLSPNTKKSKQGRPPKNSGFDFINLINPIQNAQDTNSQFVIRQNSVTFNCDKDIELTGIVEITPTLSAYLWVCKKFEYNCYVIPWEMVTSFNLKNGDKVYALLSVTDNQMKVKTIYTINDKDIKTLKTTDNYNDIATKTTNKVLSNNYNINLKQGENYYFAGNNNTDNTNTIINLLNNCKADNKIYINCALAEKNKALLSSLNKNVELFVIKLTDDTTMSKKILSLAIDRIKRAFENAQSTAIVIDDISTLLGLIPNDDLLARQLLNLTKYGANGGSITTLIVWADTIYTQRYLKLADKKFTIDDGTIK